MGPIENLKDTVIKVYLKQERDAIIQILKTSPWRFVGGAACDEGCFNIIPCVIYLKNIERGLGWDEMEDFPHPDYRYYKIIEAIDFIKMYSGPIVKSLKLLNSDGRATCAQCNGNIKEPYPGIRHCPICES